MHDTAYSLVAKRLIDQTKIFKIISKARASSAIVAHL